MRRGWLVAGVVLLVAAGGLLGLFVQVDGIAREHLSNEGFLREHPWTPEEFGLAYEALEIHGEVRLAAWWMAPPDDAPSRPAVVVVHGLDSTMAHMARRWAPMLHEAGHGVLAVDLRNHGQSDDGPLGRVSYGAAEARDVIAAAEHLVAAGHGPVVLYGGSMGAATVLHAAAQRPDLVAGVVSDSAFASLAFQARLDGAAQGHPRAVVDLVVRRMDRLAPESPLAAAAEDNVARVAAPLFLAHCANDRRVQADSFHVLVARAPPETPHWLGECPSETNDDHHVEGWLVPAYRESVLAFLAGL